MAKSTSKDDPVPDCGSPDTMPVFKKRDKVLLLVLLTELTERQKIQLRNKLGKHVKGGITIKTWTPSTGLLLSISKQGPNRDSRANIHALATLALASGLEIGTAGASFLVADGLTKRILADSCKVGESRTEIVVMVSVRTDPRRTELPPRHLRLINDEFHVQDDSEPEFELSDYARENYTIVPEPKTNTDGIRVVATRFKVKDDLAANYLLDDDDDWDDGVSINSMNGGRFFSGPKYGKLPDVLSKFQKGNSFEHYQEHEGSGFDDIDFYRPMNTSLVLRDPGAAPFTIQETAALVHGEALKALSSTHLSPELIGHTVSEMYNPPSPQYPLWKRQQTENHLHFYAMFPTTPEQLETMAQDMAKSLPKRSKTTMELISLEKHHMRSRRDVIAFYDKVQVLNPSEELGFPVLILLLEPFKPKPSGSHQCSLVYQRNGIESPLEFYRTSLSKVCDKPSRKNILAAKKDKMKTYNVVDAETSYNPEEPFYSYTPPWWAATNDEYDERKAEYKWIPVFYLTKGLTADEDTAIKRAIYRVNGEDRYDLDEDEKWDNLDQPFKEACIVPWTKDEDATLDDIFNILLEVYKYEGLDHKCTRFFCIDRKSPGDLHLLLIEADFYLSGKTVQSLGQHLQGMVAPTLRGFRYIRTLAEDAHYTKQALDVCERQIEEVGKQFDEGARYVRPGWPESGVLVPEPPYRPGWPLPGKYAPMWSMFNAARYDALVNRPAEPA